MHSMMEVFFYGLFMDESILLKNGIQSMNPRKGCLIDYALKIGNRASLLPAKGEKSYGLVMTVDKDRIQLLYAEASVADYVPETVTIVTNTSEKVEAVCYNLPAALMTGTNETYATALHQLASKEGFPPEYLEKIKKMAGENAKDKIK